MDQNHIIKDLSLKDMTREYLVKEGLWHSVVGLDHGATLKGVCATGSCDLAQDFLR